MRKSKKPKPTFDVARADLGERPAGWVYRSAAPAPSPARAPSVAPSAPPAPGPGPDPAPPEPSDRARSAQTSLDWVEAGVGVMVLPLTVAIVAMIAPLLWMLAPRSRQ
ncbi:MAG TPA: hypothetical protein VGY48_08225 [Vicinamibacterales bacterium]|nr:hypothetical protein [Vicinamibacterales bacterium]